MEFAVLGCNISDTLVLHQDVQTTRSGLKKHGTPKFFPTHFEVFGYVDESLFSMHDIAFQTDP